MDYAEQLFAWLALQSAWQTAAVAGSLVIFLRLLRGASAARRYGCAALHLWCAVASLALSLLTSHATLMVTRLCAIADPVHNRWLEGETWRFPHSVAWTWLGGVVVATSILAVRLVALQCCIRRALPAPTEISRVIEELSVEMGVNPPPQAHCAVVKCPIVAGARPGVIVVPRSFRESHSAAEIRALLAHELAHVRRDDYRRNAVQFLVVSALWWHPAAWMIYAVVRHERECAADQQAVRADRHSLSLAKALVRLAENSITADPFAVAARSSGLSDRVRRIVEKPLGNERPITVPAFGAVVTFIALTVLCNSAASHAEALTRSFAGSPLAPSTVVTISAHDPAGKFRVRISKGRVIGVMLEQQPVPANLIIQRGEIVSVLGGGGQELLRLHVDPRGGFHWTARLPS
jgi:beta-lactamase regulating signal transducer with metallopeptidase domain